MRVARTLPFRRSATLSLSSNVGIAPLLNNRQRDSGVEHTTGLPAFNALDLGDGAPAISLPLLEVEGMPVGIQIVGQPHSDHRLTRLWRMDRQNRCCRLNDRANGEAQAA